MIDPHSPVVREVNGVPVEWRDDGLPAVFANTYPYRAAAHRWEADGWRQQTAEEIAARELERAQAAEQAVLEAFPAPEVLVPRVDANFTVVGKSRLVIDAATGAPIYIVDTASPQHPKDQQKSEFADKSADHASKIAAAKVAKAKGNGLPALAERVAALEAFFGITEE